MELIHFSDTHIGVTTHGKRDPQTGLNTRILDYLESVDMVVDYVEEVQPDLVVFSGDAYHYHNPTPTYVSQFAERVKRISKTCPIVLVPGNHDIAVTREESAVDVFGRLDLPNVYTTDEPRGFQIGNVYVGCVPWPVRRDYVSPQEADELSPTEAQALYMDRIGGCIRDMAHNGSEADFAVLVGHLTVEGSSYGSEQVLAAGMESEVFLEDIALPEFDYVALGHIHHFQDLNKGSTPPVVYAGSLDRVDFLDEGRHKGLVHVTISKEGTSYQLIDIDARPMQTLEFDLQDTVMPAKEFMRLLQKADIDPHAILKVQVAVNNANDINEAEALRWLKDKVHNVAGISKDVKKRRVVRLEADVGVDSPPEQVLRMYFQEQDEDEEEVDELMSLFKEITEDVEAY